MLYPPTPIRHSYLISSDANLRSNLSLSLSLSLSLNTYTIRSTFPLFVYTDCGQLLRFHPLRNESDAAYLLAVLGGNSNPSADDLKRILGSGTTFWIFT